MSACVSQTQMISCLISKFRTAGLNLIVNCSGHFIKKYKFSGQLFVFTCCRRTYADQHNAAMDHNVEQLDKASSVTPTNYNSDYIQKALAVAYNCKQLRVESFECKAISQPGENFCSVIYRLKVSYRKHENDSVESENLIIKDLLPVVAEIGSNEKFMFERILPAMSLLLEKAPQSLGERKLSAKCLFVERAEAKETYLLEDLGALGYGSLDRFNGLSLDSARLCLQKMAQFHATSMILLDKDPQLVSQLLPSHFTTGLKDAFSQAIVLDGLAFGAEVVAELPGMAAIAAKMSAQLPDAYEQRMCAVVDAKNCALKVIVHGDLWVNNIMVNVKENKAVIVDFQNCFIGSPAIDIIFFFYTSLQLSVLLHDQDQLLRDYYTSFSETLSAFNYPSVPSFEQLQDEMQRCLFYGLYAVVCELPICCASKKASDDFGVHTFANSEKLRAKRQQLFANERVRETLQATLGHFDKAGILNEL